MELGGPTLFNPLLKNISKFTHDNAKLHPDNYTVLLILTDGDIHDMSDTVDTIVASSSLPLSIIIVGVGNENFSKMITLDSDDKKLRSSSGKLAKRDIVQFVPFKKYESETYRGESFGAYNGVNEALANAVLKELPRQVVSYYKMIGKEPNKAIQIDADNFLNVRNDVGVNLLNNPNNMPNYPV